MFLWFLLRQDKSHTRTRASVHQFEYSLAPATQSRFLPNRHRAVCRVYELVSHNMNSPFSFSLLQHHVSQKEAAAAAVRIEDSASRVRASDGVCGSIDRT